MQLTEALCQQQQSGKRLGEILLENQYTAPQQLLPVLARQLGVSYISLADTIVDPRDALSLPAALARRHQSILLPASQQYQPVAMADPADRYALTELSRHSSLPLQPVLASAAEVSLAIDRCYGITSSQAAAAGSLVQTSAWPDTEAATVINLVSAIIKQGIEAGASDIHIEPCSDYVQLRIRLDGKLFCNGRFPLNLHAAIITRLKIMANLDIAERRLPQDGRIDFPGGTNIRIATLPTAAGEKAALRLLSQHKAALAIDQLGFSPANLQLYQRLYSRPHGLLLVTGPTGSGKTTTLYATLLALNTPQHNIVTLEDPVEYRLPGINQVQVNLKAGLTFAGGLRAILRQDPDIILLGEIRDQETAQTALRMALTGHLVLSTLHSSSALGSIARLLDMGIEPSLLSAALIGIVAQRLVRRLCPHCREHYYPSPCRPEYSLWHNSRYATGAAYRSRGCSRCRSGYFGRLALQEILPVSAALRSALQSRLNASELQRLSGLSSSGSLSLDGLTKAMSGLTSLTEILPLEECDDSI